MYILQRHRDSDILYLVPLRTLVTALSSLFSAKELAQHFSHSHRIPTISIFRASEWIHSWEMSSRLDGSSLPMILGLSASRGSHKFPSVFHRKSALWRSSILRKHIWLIGCWASNKPFYSARLLVSHLTWLCECSRLCNVFTVSHPILEGNKSLQCLYSCLLMRVTIKEPTGHSIYKIHESTQTR